MVRVVDPGFCRVFAGSMPCDRATVALLVIAGLLVNLCRLRSAQRMRAICRAIEPGAVRPSMDDAGVLPRRQVWLSPQTAWKQISALASIEGGEPLADSSTGLLGNLELHRPAGLLLHDGRAIANPPTGEHVIDPQADEIAAPELAVDRQIEHRKIASATLHLQPYSNGPDILRLQRALLTGQASSAPGCTLVGGGIECSVVIVVSDADPFHLSARSVSTGCGRLTPEKPRRADYGPSRPRRERTSSTLSGLSLVA